MWKVKRQEGLCLCNTVLRTIKLYQNTVFTLRLATYWTKCSSHPQTFTQYSTLKERMILISRQQSINLMHMNNFSDDCRKKTETCLKLHSEHIQEDLIQPCSDHSVAVLRVTVCLHAVNENKDKKGWSCFLSSSRSREAVYATQNSLLIYASHTSRGWLHASAFCRKNVDCIWNMKTHAERHGFVFRRNGGVAGGRQFSRILKAEVCASAVVMLDTPYSEVVWRVLATQCIWIFPTSLPLPWVSVFHHISTGLYQLSVCGCRQNASLWGQFAQKPLINTTNKTTTRTAAFQRLSTLFIVLTFSTVVPTNSQTNPYHSLPAHTFNVHSNIIVPFTPRFHK